jgi:N,N-dimethylformamidase
MDVVGYTDRMSVAAGERLSLMVSSADPEVDVSLVRLSGAAAGSGMQDETVASAIQGTYSASPQPLRPGSYVLVEDAPELRVQGAFSITLWVMPTLLSAGRQTLIAKSDHSGMGWTLGLTPPGRLNLVIGADTGARCELVSPVPLREHVWYFVGAAFDGASRGVELVAWPSVDALAASWSSSSDPAWATTQAPVEAAASVVAPLLIAGSLVSNESGQFVSNVLNGKIAMPRLFPRALTREEILLEAESAAQPRARAAVAAWDFAQEIDSRSVLDVSGNELHGRTVQQPARAVTGPRWDGSVTSWKERPDLYDAIHFHSDDLTDAEWSPTVTWTVDSELPSGIYAARAIGVRSGEDHVPFVIRPPRDRATASVLLVAPLFSWLAYGNWRAIDGSLEQRTDRGQYIVANRLNGLYDRHTDASGVSYTSWRKPNLDMRPDHRLCGFPHQLSADLLLSDWLHREGVDFDVVTDEDLHRERAELLGRYRVVLSGTHAEYWTGPMLDGLADYLGVGGRYMYLSGNGLCVVTALNADGHTIEVRRQEDPLSAGRQAAPGEAFTSFAGEPGGLWRWRGRAPQRYVGVGYCGFGFSAQRGGLAQSAGAPYRRQPGSFDSRARFICEGLENDELIGAFQNVLSHHGAAGFELDRADWALGTPHHALVIATATAVPPDRWTLIPTDEEDEKTVASEVQTVARGVRADMVFFETQAGGAVFSPGSIAWCGALPYNDYDNNVARITRNVLRRFLEPEPFPFPQSQ